MNLLRLHLWREWRQHRAVLAIVLLALPWLTWIGSLGIPRRWLAEPTVSGAVALTFVLVVLAAVGGELLGVERREGCLRWLERMPGGLVPAFAAKLGMLLASTVTAGALGFGTARFLAHLRGAEGIAWRHDLTVALPLVLALAVWPFACSAWALRGGVSILAAALVLAVAGAPAAYVVSLGYHPRDAELTSAALVLGCCGLLSAVLAFLRGGRFGRGTGVSTLLGLVPIVPLFAISAAWSLDRLGRRERLDPRALDFAVHDVILTDDARRAFVFAWHYDEQWGTAMPIPVLQVDLADGSWMKVAEHCVDRDIRSVPDGNGTYRPKQLVLFTDESERTPVFELSDGGPASLIEKSKVEWRPLGLGQWISEPRERDRIHDPFRGRSYPTKEIPFWESLWETELVVRPGRWLCREGIYEPWFLYDPDSGARETLNVDQIDDPSPGLLAVLPDGDVLCSSFGGVYCMDLDTGVVKAIAIEGSFEFIWNASPIGEVDPVVLRGTQANESGWFVFDRDEWTLGEVPDPLREAWLESYVRRTSENTALLRHDNRLVELDLQTGARKIVFPRNVQD